LGLSHNNLSNFYTTIFELSQSPRWKLSLTEILKMIPYELEIFIALMKMKVNEEKGL